MSPKTTISNFSQPVFLIPHPALQPYIQNFTYSDYGVNGEWTSSRFNTPGCAYMPFVLNSDKVKLRFVGENNAPFEPAAFIGQGTKYKKSFLFNRLRTFFVVFQPCGAFHLLGIRQDECINSTTNLSDLLGSSIRLLRDELSGQRYITGLQRVIEEFFLKRLFLSKRMEPCTQLAQVLKQIQIRSHENNLIGPICREAGYSISRLERHTKEMVGISPKTYHRIARYNAALSYIEQHHWQCNWAAVASQFGYFDQAHFIHDFKLFYGSTPVSAFLNPGDAMSDFVNRDSHYPILSDANEMLF